MSLQAAKGTWVHFLDLPGVTTQIKYSEIERAQTIRVPWWVQLGARRAIPRVGVRLMMGEWRMRAVLIAPRLDELLDVLESHRLPVERQPIRLNPLWIGRK